MSLALAFESIEDHLPESVVWEGVELYIDIFSGNWKNLSRSSNALVLVGSNLSKVRRCCACTYTKLQQLHTRICWLIFAKIHKHWLVPQGLYIFADAH